ncbi:MAG TPA: START domain-containing protein [Thermoanaerobaculia bacterium]|nr:START domain-containing protein [Thermoanaerobaculia bacterium]
MYGVLLVVALLLTAHFAWKYSGSNAWELEIDKRGIQVYTLKKPGSTLKDVRTVRRVKTTLNRAVAAMTSIETEDCAEWGPGCEAIKTVQPWNPKDLSYIQLYRMAYPKPYAPREFLINAKVTQDPRSKVVLVDFTVLPDALPRNECCARMTVFHDTWRFTPMRDGEVEVELTAHLDPGVPYPLFNRLVPIAFYRFFNRGLDKYLNKEKFQQARFEGIEEKYQQATFEGSDEQIQQARLVGIPAK